MTAAKPSSKQATSVKSVDDCVRFIESISAYNQAHPEDEINGKDADKLIYLASFSTGQTFLHAAFRINKALHDLAEDQLNATLIQDAFDEGIESFRTPEQIRGHIDKAVGIAALRFCGLSESGVEPIAMSVALEKIREKAAHGTYTDKAIALLKNDEMLKAFFQDTNPKMHKPPARHHAPGRRKIQKDSGFFETMRKDIKAALKAKGYAPMFEEKEVSRSYW